MLRAWWISWYSGFRLILQILVVLNFLAICQSTAWQFPWCSCAWWISWQRVELMLQKSTKTWADGAVERIQQHIQVSQQASVLWHEVLKCAYNVSIIKKKLLRWRKYQIINYIKFFHLREMEKPFWKMSHWMERNFLAVKGGCRTLVKDHFKIQQDQWLLDCNMNEASSWIFGSVVSL